MREGWHGDGELHGPVREQCILLHGLTDQRRALAGVLHDRQTTDAELSRLAATSSSHSGRDLAAGTAPLGGVTATFASQLRVTSSRDARFALPAPCGLRRWSVALGGHRCTRRQCGIVAQASTGRRTLLEQDLLALAGYSARARDHRSARPMWLPVLAAFRRASRLRYVCRLSHTSRMYCIRCCRSAHRKCTIYGERSDPSCKRNMRSVSLPAQGIRWALRPSLHRTVHGWYQPLG
jgi:hypothetical protein